ncbi:hypothetical protein KSS87_011744, partial [Heliosperma pusillum]
IKFKSKIFKITFIKIKKGELIFYNTEIIYKNKNDLKFYILEIILQFPQYEINLS